MVTQVLIIHGLLPFAITLKQTLERGAPFEAHPFTSVEAAAEYLRDHVQDVALVDFTIPDFPGDQVVELLREIQSNIAIIATPRQSDDVMRTLDLQASIKTGFNARDLIGLINAYFADNPRPSYVPPKSSTALLGRLQPNPPEQSSPVHNRPPALPEPPEHSSLDSVLSSMDVPNLFEDPLFEPGEGDTPASSVEDIAWAHEPPRHDSSFDEVLNALPLDASDAAAPNNPFNELVNSMRTESAHRPLPSRQEQFVEFILSSGMDSLIDEIGQAQAAPQPPLTPESTFEKLAQEEPPPPTFEESGSVSDLVTGFQDRSFRNVLSILRGEEVQDSEPVLPPLPVEFEPEERSHAIPQLTDQHYFEDTSTPARVILQRTLEQNAGSSDFSLEELLKNIEEQFPQHHPRVLPLPAWLTEQHQRQDAFMVREPDFLPEELPPEPTPSEDLYPNQTTQPARGQQIEAHPEAMETDWIERSAPVAEETASFPTTLPEEIPAEATVPHEATAMHDPTASTGIWHHLPDQDFNTQFEMMAAFEVHDEKGVSTGALYTEMPVEPPLYPAEWGDDSAPSQQQPAAPRENARPVVPAAARPPSPPTPPPAPQPVEDPYIAQLALSLTEVSLELTAEATLLARDGQIIAFAGRMERQEIEELRGAIADDWNAAPGEVRIRFLTSKGSGRDYMLYSRRTEDDFTLSLIFAGTTPLRDIRRQGQRLVDSLLAVPEPAALKAETVRTPAVKQETAPQVDTSTRTPYACVWLLRDPSGRLDPVVSQAIISGLNIQMQERHWHIQDLQVRSDHVYLLAEVPGEDPAFKIVRDLKRRSAELAHAQNAAYAPDRLWSDGYLVVTPGRALDSEEIQQFIDFERME